MSSTKVRVKNKLRPFYYDSSPPPTSSVDHVPSTTLPTLILRLVSQVVSPTEWRSARLTLLAKEKEATRAQDALAKERQSMPVVEVTKPYEFTALCSQTNEKKTLSLLDLFGAHRQLIIYHFMFSPDWEEGCASCSFLVDNLPALEHLNSRNTGLVVVSRAPIEKIAAYKKRMGWTFDWVSSYESDFNYDYHVTQDAEKAPIEYNFRTREQMEERGIAWGAKGEQPGFSTFIRGGKDGVGEEGKIYHTYSTYSRGVEKVAGTFTLLDMTYLGRQDTKAPGVGFPRRDQYTPEELNRKA